MKNKTSNLKAILEAESDIELPKSAWASKVSNFIFKIIFFIYFKFEKRDLYKMDVEGAALFVGNHQSYLDAIMFNQMLTNKQLENNYFIATAMHFKSKLKRYLVNNGNIVLVDSNKGLKTTLQIAAKILKNGKKLVMFPEGTRTKDGNLQEFKKTFAILAKELNVPIIPFAIDGAYLSMPYGKAIPKRVPIKITVLDKIDTNSLSVEEIIKETKNRIQKSLDETK